MFFGLLLISKYFHCVSPQSVTYRQQGRMRPRANCKQRLLKQTLGLAHSQCVSFQTDTCPKALTAEVTESTQKGGKSQIHRSALVVSHCSSDS